MPALASFTVNDRESTPVAHVFAPVSANPPTYVESRSDGAKVGENRITVAFRRTARGYTARAALTAPVVITEVINGVSELRALYADHGKVEYSFDARSTKQRRENVCGMLNNACAPGTQVDKVLSGGEMVY